MKNTIQLSKLRLDGGTQPRVKIDTDVVQDYSERIKAGDDFPPVDVFFDGADHWLAEGFHRYHAVAALGQKTIACTLRKGTVRDAILFSCGVNSHHGLPRTNGDKRKAVLTLLNDEEWCAKADNWIAERCVVSVDLVRRVRAEDSDLRKEIRMTRDGKTINTANRGRPKVNGKPPKSPPIFEDDDDEPTPAKAPETNHIGEMLEAFDSYVEELLDGRPEHFRVALMEHMREMAE
jgi:hypothetical protein